MQSAVLLLIKLHVVGVSSVHEKKVGVVDLSGCELDGVGMVLYLTDPCLCGCL